MNNIKSFIWRWKFAIIGACASAGFAQDGNGWAAFWALLYMLNMITIRKMDDLIEEYGRMMDEWSSMSDKKSKIINDLFDLLRKGGSR